ncbi:MAG TPA: hypothetical protein ENH97_01260 [bacterium]|nr:hypothetical protein [bacterium]
MTLVQIYKRLLKHFGRQHWWPADTPFEVIVGAILTQQTTWRNVEKAIDSLKEDNLLDISSLARVNLRRLEKVIRPAGYFHQKAERLRGVCQYIYKNYGDDLDKLFSQPIPNLREELLSLKGLGLETVDSIILYAANKPVFVIDAYTKRMAHRLGMTNLDKYEDLRRYFENYLPNDLELYQEFHALIVELGKNYCKTKPNCQPCPLRKGCQFKRINS